MIVAFKTLRVLIRLQKELDKHLRKWCMVSSISEIKSIMELRNHNGQRP